MMSKSPLSIDEICKYLGISRNTFYKWLKIKEFPSEFCLPAYERSRLGVLMNKDKQQRRHYDGESDPDSPDDLKRQSIKDKGKQFLHQNRNFSRQFHKRR